MENKAASRRKTIKTITSSIAVGVGMFVTSQEAAAEYDHEVVVTNANSGGKYICEVPYDDGDVDFKKWEITQDSLNPTDDGRIQAEMNVSPGIFGGGGKDVFLWNGELEQFQTIRYDSGVRVEVDGELIPRNADYPFK